MKVLVLARMRGAWSDMASWIEGMGGEVVPAVSCKIALQVLESDPTIDLVIIESTREDHAGTKLLSVVKGSPRLANLSVIVASGEFGDHDVQRYLSLGVDDIIVLPIQAETFEAKILKAMKRGKKKILVVDDEPMIRDLLANFLRVERYAPIKVASADEALELLGHTTVDAVVSDIMMPGMDGLELLKRVKEGWPYLPVILITGNAAEYTPERAIEIGADGFFAKPFKNQELNYTLRSALARYSRVSPQLQT